MYNQLKGFTHLPSGKFYNNRKEACLDLKLSTFKFNMLFNHGLFAIANPTTNKGDASTTN